MSRGWRQRPHIGHELVSSGTDAGCAVPTLSVRSAGGCAPGHAQGAAPGTAAGGMRPYGDAGSGSRRQPWQHGAWRATLSSAVASVHASAEPRPRAYAKAGIGVEGARRGALGDVGRGRVWCADGGACGVDAVFARGVGRERQGA